MIVVVDRYGLLADILECLIQRDFSYNTMDVRMTYDYLKACLCDPTISKIVLVAHSQGGIIVSMALDYLFADLPHGVFGKLVGQPSRISRTGKSGSFMLIHDWD